MAQQGVVHFFKGGTREQYENGLKVIHPDKGKGLPAGQTLHFAGPSKDGWLIVAVFDSAQSWERFRDETLHPGLAKGENGLPGPPQEFTPEIAKTQTA